MIEKKCGYEIYNTMEELPDWAKESITKAMEANVLKGTGKGLGLTLTEIKVLVWMDRAGMFE